MTKKNEKKMQTDSVIRYVFLFFFSSFINSRLNIPTSLASEKWSSPRSRPASCSIMLQEVSSLSLWRTNGPWHPRPTSSASLPRLLMVCSYVDGGDSTIPHWCLENALIHLDSFRFISSSRGLLACPQHGPQRSQARE